MARVATVRARCIALADSLGFDAENDKGEHMAAYVREAQKPEHFGWTEGNAKNSYRWCVKNGHFKGNIVTSRKAKDEPAKDEVKEPTISITDVAKAAVAELELPEDAELRAMLAADEDTQPVA